MSSRVVRSTFLGHEAVMVQNDQLELVLVPALGSNLIAMTHVPSGIPLLRTPPSMEAFHVNPYLNGIPILFPPNRLEDGKLTDGSAVYHFDINEPKYHNHIHGLVHDKPWTVDRAEVDGGGAIVETSLDSRHFPDILRQFPHPFSLRLEVALVASTVSLAMSVTNHSDRAFPWGLGYHTTFRFPLALDGDLSRCRFRLSAKQRWMLTDRLLPTGERKDSPDLPDFRNGIVLVDKPLDDVFLSEGGNGQANECVLMDPDARLTLTYRADSNFLHWVVYNADSRQGYVCPEPYTWVTNAPNLPLDPALTGLRWIQPGATERVATEIHVQSMNGHPGRLD